MNTGIRCFNLSSSPVGGAYEIYSRSQRLLEDCTKVFEKGAEEGKIGLRSRRIASSFSIKSLLRHARLVMRASISASLIYAKFLCLHSDISLKCCS